MVSSRKRTILRKARGVNFRFQYPGGNATFLQALAESSVGAVSGGGIFAWATSSGLSTLFLNPDFEEFVSSNPFRLVVGTDSITDGKAIAKLLKLSEAFPLLDVKALVNDERPLFHPKLAWFQREESVSILMGSANLTQGGLIGNWEAVAVSEQPIETVTDLQTSIDDWLEDANPGLLPLTDARVQARVALNSGDERSVKKPSAPVEPSTLTKGDYSSWLVAQLNKSRKNSQGESMFSQASFDGSTFKKFFDYVGGEVEIVLWPVNLDGSLGSLESRKGRYKSASVNYYFELGTVQGLPYPSEGRPIAVFGRLGGGGYTYRVFLPGTVGHEPLDKWLADTTSGVGSARMLRRVVTTDELAKAWPENPLLNAEAPSS